MKQRPIRPFSTVTSHIFHRFLMLDGENKVIRDAVQGESSAFGLLYDHYQPQIYRFVFLKVSRREEAEDLTHQVFLSAWQNMKGYVDQGYPFSAWLYRIARNEIIDYYRTRKGTVSIDEVDPEYFAAVENIIPATERNMAIRQALLALKTLKQEYQDVVIMRFVEELSPKEVAVALGKTEGAVKLIQHRALRQLQTILSKQTLS